MSIVFVCPHCQTELKAENNLAGKNGACPKCGRRIVVPKKDSGAQSEGKETAKKE